MENRPTVAEQTDDNEIAEMIRDVVPKLQFVSLTRAAIDLPDDAKQLSFVRQFIIEIDPETFNRFTALEKIDLSHNLISDFDFEYFARNLRLREIHLGHNCLQTCDKIFFSFMSSLILLDLSGNLIGPKIANDCICSHSLTELNLSSNRIEEIAPKAFHSLPTLKSLNVSNNRLIRLDIVALQLIQLICDQNPLQSIKLVSERIQSLNAENNQLTSFDSIELSSTSSLKVLTLLNREENPETSIVSIYSLSFFFVVNLEVLKISVRDLFVARSLRCLRHLKYFYLNYYGLKFFVQENESFIDMLSSSRYLTVLILIVKHFDPKYLQNFHKLPNLDTVLVKCLRPSRKLHKLNIQALFGQNRYLKTLTLIDLNNCHVLLNSRKICQDRNSLRKLTCFGLKNRTFEDYWNRFRNLVHLNVSHGEINDLNPKAFRRLNRLKYLYLEHLKIERIMSDTFIFNSNLEILSLSNNRIQRIDPFAFSNLKQLKLLDLSGNQLSSDYISCLSFRRLRTFGTEVVFDDPSFSRYLTTE